MPVVLSASRKGFGVLVKGRKADNRGCQSGPLSAENRLAEEGGGCLERKPRGRGQTGAGTGTVANFLLFLRRRCVFTSRRLPGQGVTIAIG